VETAAKNTARADAEAVIRPFKRRYLDGPPITNEDLIAMGLPVRDKRAGGRGHELYEQIGRPTPLRSLSISLRINKMQGKR
jgi:hypothetical protein